MKEKKKHAADGRNWTRNSERQNGKECISKPRYPALDIAYLAVQQKWRGIGIGNFIIKEIAIQARNQTFAGCQFLTVEALATKEYSAVGFYEQCGFTANEVKKPYKDTLRMYCTLFEKDTNLEYEEE